MSKFDLAVYIGRFQPFHKGHEHVIRECLEKAHGVLVLVGSSFRPRTPKNPFTYEERCEMIRSVFPDTSRVRTAPIRDFYYSDEDWIEEVTNQVYKVQKALVECLDREVTVTLVGHTKDESSYYLSKFPLWSYTEVENFENISATPIRSILLSPGMTYVAGIGEVLSPSVSEVINRVVPDLEDLRWEIEWAKTKRREWDNTPYPVNHVTVDGVVVNDDHILLVRRGRSPGKGLLALPGGFLEPTETLEQGVIREVREETGLCLDPEFQVFNYCFDKVDRSIRGRVLSVAFLFDAQASGLGNSEVSSGDDAAEAMWYPIKDLRSEDLFEDHYDIICWMLDIHPEA